MLDNTYDATGYNFGVLLTTSERLNNKIDANIINMPENQWPIFSGEILNSSDMRIVNFSEIDGLTIGNATYDGLFIMRNPENCKSVKYAINHTKEVII